MCKRVLQLTEAWCLLGPYIQPARSFNVGFQLKNLLAQGFDLFWYIVKATDYAVRSVGGYYQGSSDCYKARSSSQGLHPLVSTWTLAIETETRLQWSRV